MFQKGVSFGLLEKKREEKVRKINKDRDKDKKIEKKRREKMNEKKK